MQSSTCKTILDVCPLQDPVASQRCRPPRYSWISDVPLGFNQWLKSSLTETVSYNSRSLIVLFEPAWRSRGSSENPSMLISAEGCCSSHSSCGQVRSEFERNPVVSSMVCDIAYRDGDRDMLSDAWPPFAWRNNEQRDSEKQG